MTVFDPSGKPHANSPVLASRFEWPDVIEQATIPGFSYGLRTVARVDNALGIAPVPMDDETELDRFVVSWVRAILSVDARGLPSLDPSMSGNLKEICIGAGEVLVTENRLAIVLIQAESGPLGNAKDEHGSVIAFDVPFRAINSIALTRKKKFRKVKDDAVRLYIGRPAGAIDLEPLARTTIGSDKPTPTSLPEFFDIVVMTACRHALSATLMELPERQRLERILNGARMVEDLDVVAEINN